VYAQSKTNFFLGAPKTSQNYNTTRKMQVSNNNANNADYEIQYAKHNTAPTNKKQLAMLMPALTSPSRKRQASVESRPLAQPTNNKRQKSQEEETCFICLGDFSDKNPKTHIPCANNCQSPVHSKCIYEWSESKESSTRNSCPLCRGELGEIEYIPRDRIGSHLFSDVNVRKDFLTHPVPKGLGPLRCYVRTVKCGYLNRSTRYELYLQAPTTLKYPLGPLPNIMGPKPGDILLAVSHKYVSRWGCAQLDVTMEKEAQGPSSSGTIATMYSSFTGLEHSIVGVQQTENGTSCMSELGAIRYTQNRIGKAVGPRRIHVCFPNIVQTNNKDQVVPASARPLPQVFHGPGVSHPVEEEDDEEEEQVEIESYATLVHKPVVKEDSLCAKLRDNGKRAKEDKTEKCLFGSNRTPYWLPAINAFSLDFGGRVTLPSNKNFQLVVNENEQASQGETDVSLQFGKVGETEEGEVFTMDVAFPLSPLQAFGVCLSSCDHKLMVF